MKKTDTESKQEERRKKVTDVLYTIEQEVIKFIETIEYGGNERWVSIGKTDIQKGFMALRKGVAEKYKIKKDAVDY